MAPPWRVVVQRDGSASQNSDEASHLSTGGIIGIACGAGALFLGSIILFIIYWRKQKRHDVENAHYRAGHEGGHFTTSDATPIYTLDYKGGEHVAVTPPTSNTAKSGFTPLVEMASAMPAHPAYIPRALVRQNGSERGTPSTMSPASGTISQFKPTSSRQDRNKAEQTPPAAQTTLPGARRDAPKRQPAAQTHDEYESDSVTQAQPSYTPRRRPSVGTGIPGPIPVPVPALTMPTQSSARRVYSPPQLNLSNEPQRSKYINTTSTNQTMSTAYNPHLPAFSGNIKVPISAVDISGPLAFPPQLAPPPPPPPSPPLIQLGGPRQQQEHHRQYQKDLEIQLQLDQDNNSNYYYEESSSATGPSVNNSQYSLYRGGRSGPPHRGPSFRDRSLSSTGDTSRSRSNRGGDRSDGGAIDPYYYSSLNRGGRQGQQYHHHQYQQRQATHYEEVEIGRSSDDDIW